jgi:hypothetical protein
LVAAKVLKGRNRPGACGFKAKGEIMGSAPKSRTAIYHPPKAGMPYLVVTVTRDGVSAVPAESKDEARALAFAKARDTADKE